MSLSLCLFLGQFRIFHRQSNCLPSPNLFIETIAPVDRSSEFKKFLNPLEENKKRKREKGCNRIRISKPAGFLFSIATPFLRFFLSLSPPLSLFSRPPRFVFRGTPCTSNYAFQRGCVYTKGGRRTSEMQIGGGRNR